MTITSARPQSGAETPRRRTAPRRSRVLRIVGGLLVALTVGYLYVPPLVIALFSFSDRTVQTLPLGDLTLQWYEALVRDRPMLDAVQYSLQVTGTAIAVSLALGTLFAVLLWRNLKGAEVFNVLLALPLLLPGMVLGVSMTLTFRFIGLKPGFLPLVITHAVYLVPIVVFVVGQRLATLDPALIQASHDLGATSVKTFVRVILPLIGSALAASALLCFTISFDELPASFFVAGFDPTLPIYVWTLLRRGFTPSVNAVFTLLAITSILLLAIGAFMYFGRGKWNILRRNRTRR